MAMACNLNGIAGKGRCCCNCEHQMLAMKHPWNEGKAQGRITDIFGALCAAPEMMSAEGRRQAVFFDTGHGMCEMHEFRTPLSNQDCDRHEYISTGPDGKTNCRTCGKPPND